jgi:tripartite ATP-independent transporter DctM subunit
MLIPPSVLLVIYGVLSEEAIGRLFIAGIVPGVILTLIYALGIGFMAYRRPQLILTRDAVTESEASQPRIGYFRFLKSFSTCWGVVVLIGVTLGGIWLGFFTPTEAGAVGAFGALVLGLVKRQLSFSKLWKVLLETGITVASIFFLLIAGQMYSRMLALSGTINWLSSFVTSLALPPIFVILLLLLLLFILGAILDSTSIMLMTLPLMLPIVESLGYDLIWFGIVFVVVVEMGLLTPPFGMVVFAMKAALGEEAQIDEIFRGSYPFLFMMAIFVVIIIAFPILITWLPSFM